MIRIREGVTLAITSQGFAGGEHGLRSGPKGTGLVPRNMPPQPRKSGSPVDSCQAISTYTMSIFMDIMKTVTETALAERLERLTGDPADECLLRYQSKAIKLERTPEFRESLRRFSALADRRRLLALRLLSQHPELCACEIQAAVGLSHPAVSYHMGILVKAGLVGAKRRGKWIRYWLLPGTKALLG